ncbi:MAG: protein-L-isoaspartate(D-aspartate) O-methyltransferase [Desulfobaccales bacterium]
MRLRDKIFVALRLRSTCLALLAGAVILAGLGAGAGSAPALDNFEDARQVMVARQLQRRDITDPRVLIAMGTVPRHRFVPGALASQAYGDHPLPIGGGQTISQPYIVALMTQWAEVAPGDKVLEVGTGSGYQAAVLAELTEKVFSIEIRPELARRASALLQELGYGRVQVRSGDGYRGWPEEAPFDAILVTAAAPRVPPDLAAQLKEGGRLVIPLGGPSGSQTLVRYRKVQGKLVEEASLAVRFVPLVHPPSLEAAPGADPPAAPGPGAPGR